MLIKITDACLTYLKGTTLETRALDNVSLEINTGESVGLIGSIGSGKSTLGQVLAGLLRLDSGQLHIEDRAVPGQIPIDQVYKYCGFLFQKPEDQIFESNVYEEVAFGPRNQGLGEKEVEILVKESLRLVGLDFDVYKERSPFALSGGEVRRVCVASIIALNSEIIIMDEPTAGLDVDGKSKVLKYLGDIKKKKTFVFISHDLSDILQVCDRLLVLNKGKIALDIAAIDIWNYLAEIEKIGLSIPEELQLAKKLRNCGYRINRPIRTNILQAIEEKLSG